MNKFGLFIGILVILVGMLISSCSSRQPDNSRLTLSSPVSTNDSPSITTVTNETPIQESWGTDWRAPLTVNQSYDGKTIRVNLVKFVVNAPADAKVTINNIPPVEDTDGSYYAFLDLTPGKNIIQVKTTFGKNVNASETTITFSPPLYVYLNSPDIDTNNPDIDYSKTPINITGYVSNPRASVKVNDLPVSVNQDGTFSIQIPGKNTAVGGTGTAIATVKATLGDESDSDTIPMFVENGRIGYIPGMSIIGSTQFSMGDISCSPGQSTTVTGTLRVRNDIEPGGIARFDLGIENPGIKVKGQQKCIMSL